MDTTTLLGQKIKEAVKKLYSIEVAQIVIEKPDNEQFGDFATNIALLISKDIRKVPLDIAHELAMELQSMDITFEKDSAKYKVFEKIEAVRPGFINFKLSKDFLISSANEILEVNDAYGASAIGGHKNVIIEYSQPNPNKPMHIGHSRNNFLGSSLAKILEFVGYKVTKANYMNDWGTHIAKSMLMYQKFGNDTTPSSVNEKPDHFVGKFYVMYEVQVEQHPELADELAEMFRKMEALDRVVLALWEKVTGWVYEGWKETYANENVAFDVWFYQHDYRESGKEVVAAALEKGIAEKDPSGAVIARLEKYGLPDKVLLRADGTSIYSTQDLQLAKDNYEKYHFDKRIYVVDARQSDYFKQIFKVTEILGFEFASKLHHVGYGFVALPEGKMSSRKGNVVAADDVFNKLCELERTEIAGSIKGAVGSEETVRRVALAAYRYSLLKVDPKQDIIFNYSQVTKFDGNTGPYLLYTYARACSVLEKAGYMNKSLEPYMWPEISLETKEESLVRNLIRFESVVLAAADGFAPNIIANYVYDIAQKFNSFYGECPILSAPTEEKKLLRLVLTKATSQVIKNGLGLLGIDVVEKM